ncbi:MAG: hypothetical protein R3D27_00690 [Hyphomicrobiaceae bacterium]
MVKPGDRILVGAGGQARVSYSEACVTRVVPHAVLIVAHTAPCDGMMRSGAARRENVVPEVSTVGDGLMLLPAGALAAGAIAGFIVNANGGGNPVNPPASP